MCNFLGRSTSTRTRTTISLLPEEELAAQIDNTTLPSPVRGYKFAKHVKRKFAFDFCWTDRMIAVEVEGGTRFIEGGGRHNRHEGFRKDTEKYNLAGELGWTVYRYVSQDIYNGHALNDLHRILEP